jgi:hypothetical protein
VKILLDINHVLTVEEVASLEAGTVAATGGAA